MGRNQRDRGGPATDPHFSLLGGGIAELSNDRTYYEVVLFQTFDLPAAAQNLSFNFAWDKTDAFDIVQASLVDAMLNLYDLFPAGLDTTLLTNSGFATTGITALAGQTVTIELLLSDGDFNEQDRFSIGNIAIAERAAPAPGTLLLLASGLLGLAPRLRGRCSGLRGLARSR